jgi:hypothetical protein
MYDGLNDVSGGSIDSLVLGEDQDPDARALS